MNLIQIAKSWYDFSQGSDYTKALMESRLTICDNCPEKVQMDSLGQAIVTSINAEASIYKCGKCNCPLSPKTAHPANTCPLGKWGVAGSEF